MSKIIYYFVRKNFLIAKPSQLSLNIDSYLRCLIHIHLFQFLFHLIVRRVDIWILIQIAIDWYNQGAFSKMLLFPYHLIFRVGPRDKSLGFGILLTKNQLRISKLLNRERRVNRWPRLKLLFWSKYWSVSESKLTNSILKRFKLIGKPYSKNQVFLSKIQTAVFGYNFPRCSLKSKLLKRFNQ